MVEDFEREYQRQFGQGAGYRAAGITVVNLAVTARADISGVQLRPSRDLSEGAPPETGERMVIWYEQGPERQSTPVYDGSKFAPGMQVAGPAIVEYPHTNLVVRAAQTATVDPFGNVGIAVRRKDSTSLGLRYG